MDFLKDNIADFNQQFYVCGPPPMMKQVLMHLSNLGVDNDSITIEKI
jgi:ferredoxin-NADP reductase